LLGLQFGRVQMPRANGRSTREQLEHRYAAPEPAPRLQEAVAYAICARLYQGVCVCATRRNTVCAAVEAAASAAIAVVKAHRDAI
jgi:hypothetical protein